MREPVWSEAEVNMAFHYSKSALSVIEHTTGQLSKMLNWSDTGEGSMGAKGVAGPSGVSGVYEAGYDVPNHDQKVERLNAGLKRIHLASSRLRHVFQSLLLECGHPQNWCYKIDPDADLMHKVSFYRGVRNAVIHIKKKVTSTPTGGQSYISLPISPLHWEFLTDTLFGNAISYSGDRPPVIKVGWKTTKSRFDFTIHDRGVGIHTEDLPHITEPFYRGRNAGHMPGSGSGLFLISKMLRSCGGQMMISSKIDRFTKVKISIPLR